MMRRLPVTLMWIGAVLGAGCGRDEALTPPDDDPGDTPDAATAPLDAGEFRCPGPDDQSVPTPAPGFAGPDTWPADVAVAGGETYVVGHIFWADGAQVSNIAVWGGASWEALGQPGLGELWSVAADGAGTVWVVGDREDPTVTRWDGSAWAPILEIGALELHSLAAVPGGVALYGAAGVRFHDGASWSELDTEPVTQVVATADGFCASGASLRCWNGIAWSALGADPAARGRIARASDGRWFRSVDGQITLLDGDGAWQPVGDPNPGGGTLVLVDDQVVHYESDGVVELQTAAGGWETLVAEATGWVGNHPGPGLEGTLTDAAAAGDRLVVTGVFCHVDGVIAASVASVGLDGSVQALTSLD